MNATPKLAVAALAALLIVTEAHAMRWYSPNTGRWLSRDPIQDPGFYLFQTGRQVSDAPRIFFLQANPVESAYRLWRTTPAARFAMRWDTTHRMNQFLGALGGANLYVFVDNGPIDNIDPLGLIKFGKNCTAQQKADIQKAMADICQKAKNNSCFRCLSGNGQRWMKGFCDDKLKGIQEPTFECDDATTNPECANDCGNSVPWSRVIHLCFNNINNTSLCPGMGCTIIHEATHGIAGQSGEVKPYGIEKCAGCRIPPEQQVPPGY